MTIENISLFQAMNAKMNFLAAEQKVISQNISHADSPGYISQELKKPDFSKMVENISRNRNHISLETSNPNHLTPSGTAAAPKLEKNPAPYDIKPNGNSVVIEEQMIKSNEVQLNYAMMLNLYRSTADMIKTSLGRKQ